MPHIVQTRGACVESVHPWSAVAVREGAVVGRLGDDWLTTFRSASKPFQLACSLEVLGDPRVTEEQTALGAASHSGEERHLRIVQGILDAFGVRADGLRCGAHPPVHGPSAEAILRAGGVFTDLHNNCSGKHAFMLAASARAGLDLDYRPPGHPLQALIADRLAGWAGARGDVAVDGCGVPTFALPLSAVARAWSRVAEAMDVEERGDEPASADTGRLGRIGWAMANRPELTSGEGRLDLLVVRAAQEPMAVKIGAMGLFCIALPRRRLGIAVKVRSGSTDALAPAVVRALEVLAEGAWAEPEGFPLRDVRNVVGRVVGRWESVDGVW